MEASGCSRRRLRELVGTDLPDREANRLARVDAFLRDAAGRPNRTLRERTQVRLTFDELALVYKSLQAAKTLGVTPPQDELLEDTIQAVDQALDEARSEAVG